MNQPASVTSQTTTMITAEITRCGHNPIIAHGTAVQATHKSSAVRMYDELNSEVGRSWPTPPDKYVSTEDAGVGLVLDHRYHICPLEMSSATIKQFDGRFHVNGVYEHLWYCIMFKKGLYWARWNWIEILVEPAEVELARAFFSQGAEAR